MSSSSPYRLRPSRITPVGLAALAGVILAGFVSGVMVWVGQSIQEESLEGPGWLRPALVVHGWLFPIHCILFGILMGQHIRIGFRMRANLPSGVLLTSVFLGLILTGTGLYYTSPGGIRACVLWTHRILGLAFPLFISLHWMLGRRWANEQEKGASPCPPSLEAP